jgi:hypothetical protein
LIDRSGSFLVASLFYGKSEHSTPAYAKISSLMFLPETWIRWLVVEGQRGGSKHAMQTPRNQCRPPVASPPLQRGPVDTLSR